LTFFHIAEKPPPMMLHIPGILTAAEAAHMRERLDAADWVDGAATVGAQGAGVKRNRQLPEHSPLGAELGAAVREALRRSPLFFAAALPRTIAPPLFNRYEGGETYGLHVDGAVRPAPDGAPIRTDLSCTLFLAEPDAYDGGELEVVDTYGTHEVKLPAGDLILYPSRSLHRVAPVTRGARVASFFWLQSMIRDDANRALLLEMDQAISAVRAKQGDSAEVVALTGCYHNLLRTWAET
jgi:PKHD-type hydroxylase